ncbi:stalk domain-containing protein [Paenibacillus puldeungensis]|uniref:Stalk domain-containing protein n=1 Tax=Paenibacillus puldeungensis TaxID=696536 RepID=A0ABW3RWT6_9BACL
MKKSIYTLLTLCIGIIIGMTSTAAAAPVREYVQASFEKIKFVVNGEEKHLDADPLIYQGATYLPVRTILNTLGYDAIYKADSKTILADKSSDKPITGANTPPQNEGDKLPTLKDLRTKEDQIKDLQNSIKSAKEVVSDLQIAIDQVKNDNKLDEKQKNEKVATYESRYNDFSSRIKQYEEQLAELQK